MLARKDVKRIVEQADKQANDVISTQAGRTFFQLRLAPQAVRVAQKVDAANPQAVF